METIKKIIDYLIGKIQSKLLLILIGLAVFTVGKEFVSCNRIANLKAENERISSNFENGKFILEKVINEKNELVTSTQQLTLELDEAKVFNKELTNKVTELGVKLKNAQSSTKIEYVYVVKIDTFPVPVKLNDTIFKFEYDNKFIEFNQRISLIENKSNLKIDSLDFKLKGDLNIVTETLYKRKFIFWRKPIGAKIYVNSDNPYFDVDKIETIVFK